MGDPFVTATRRGLVLTGYSEIPLTLGLLVFAIQPERVGFLMFGIVGSFLMGAPAGWKLWGGRREFGPAHERSIRKVAFSFSLMTLCLLLAFFQVTEVVPDPENLSIDDLRAPLFFLGFVILLDAASMRFLVRELVSDAARRWLLTVLLVAFVATAAYLYLGWREVEDYIERSSGFAFNSMEARVYTHDFTIEVVRLFAVALLWLRPPFWAALYDAFVQVEVAEKDARGKFTNSAPSGPREATPPS